MLTLLSLFFDLIYAGLLKVLAVLNIDFIQRWFVFRILIAILGFFLMIGLIYLFFLIAPTR